MATEPRPRAVLFDAYETLVRLDDPVGRLVGALAEAGFPNPPDAVARAFAAEVAYYRANQDRGRDWASLDLLRRDCADVLRGALDVEPPRDVACAVLLRSLVWDVFPDVIPTLDALVVAGYRLGIVSNWDVSLGDVLSDLGLAGRFDFVAVSAVVGARKPDAAIFRHALRRLGVCPGDAVHVGNDPELDVRGALGAGLRAVLLDRAAVPPLPAAPVVRRLTDLPANLAAE